MLYQTAEQVKRTNDGIIQERKCSDVILDIEQKKLVYVWTIILIEETMYCLNQILQLNLNRCFFAKDHHYLNMNQRPSLLKYESKTIIT